MGAIRTAYDGPVITGSILGFVCGLQGERKGCRGQQSQMERHLVATVNIMGKLAFRGLGLLWLFGAASFPGWGKVAVVLSTDVGNEIDDQWAITYMLANPAFDVQGVISAHAPSLPDPSAHATYLVLKDVVERRLGLVSHPPLFEGSNLPLANVKTPRPNSGVDFLVDASKRFTQQKRLVVLTIGAATDVASAILQDPSIVNRIKVVAMGFKNLTDGGKEYNVENDAFAWQVILDSNVPVTIGCADVCQRYLALGFEDAKKMISEHGPIGEWLWNEYQAWYFRSVKPLREHDFSKSWVIWDIITLADELGMTTEETISRPRLNSDLSFAPGQSGKTIKWITAVDSARLWDDFIRKLDQFQRTHAVGSRN